MKVYLAVPIIAHRDMEKTKTLAKAVRDLGRELVSGWVITEDPGFNLSASYVFERDLRGVENCDIIVAEVSHGSHGVGMEVMAAHLYGKPVILMFEEGARVSHMLLGVPKALLLTYNSLEDMEVKLRSALEKASKELGVK